MKKNLNYEESQWRAKTFSSIFFFCSQSFVFQIVSLLTIHRFYLQFTVSLLIFWQHRRWTVNRLQVRLLVRMHIKFWGNFRCFTIHFMVHDLEICFTFIGWSVWFTFRRSQFRSPFTVHSLLLVLQFTIYALPFASRSIVNVFLNKHSLWFEFLESCTYQLSEKDYEWIKITKKAMTINFTIFLTTMNQTEKRQSNFELWIVNHESNYERWTENVKLILQSTLFDYLLHRS